jgi:AraC-like DNA-binding protein
MIIHIADSLPQQIRHHSRSSLGVTIPQSLHQCFLLRYIQEHAASVTLNELSRLFNYSERQIQRVLKKSTGKSFTEITQSIRMEEAARLLRRTRDPVSKIAQELGYANLGNFRKLFRKRYGMSPAEYRRVPEAARTASAEAAPG